MSSDLKSLAEQIRDSEKSRLPVETKLTTDDKVLARITDGIYRQPASALRELISNAYDADASEVIISTDAPRFAEITVRDDGSGLSPEVVEHLVKHIGGSAKRTEEGKELGVTSASDVNLSPAKRQLIGKMGIGLFSVAQFTRHFLIFTKTKDDPFRTVADITLGPVAGQDESKKHARGKSVPIETGHARIWRERAENPESQGTEVKLLELLPRTRAELSSADLWAKLAFEKGDPDTTTPTPPPQFHIGQMKPGQSEVLDRQPALPWNAADKPDQRFAKLVEGIRNSVGSTSEHVDLDQVCDRYVQMMWNLALAAPLKYFDGHPFDLEGDCDVLFFEFENRAKGQAKELKLKKKETPRKTLGLKAPDGPSSKLPFDVYLDGVQLARPVLFKDLPQTSTAVKSPLLFVGRDEQRFEKKPVELSGGPLLFEAYLFWAPKIIPKQHQGVALRVGNASGALFDRTFMGYQVSEQTRTRQITAEILVLKGLDGAINLDRESFNYAHPHYQYLVKWLHSALRQLANRHKELGRDLRKKKVSAAGAKIRAGVERTVEEALRARGVAEVADVVLANPGEGLDVKALRKKGTIVLQREAVVARPKGKATATEIERRKNAEMKAVAIAQLLEGWGLLESLSYAEQERLIGDIMDIVLLDDSELKDNRPQ